MTEDTNKKASARPLRCHCGSLLARIVPEGVELKCRRCKRQVIVPLAELGREETEDEN
jgi:phage FluMu protein Com